MIEKVKAFAESSLNFDRLLDSFNGNVEALGEARTAWRKTR